MSAATDNSEQKRLSEQRTGSHDWHRWGPYLAERAWGTVREDYSANGDAWHYFPFEHAHARAYRWNEDGLGGICDRDQHLCFAMALWNEQDSILKERAYGLTNAQGNRGEEVKEYYFYLDATPTHSWMRYLYKYPQTAFPYAEIIAENAKRQRSEQPFGLMDTKAFESGYWDVLLTYAKISPDDIYIRVTATNRGPQPATLHLLPTLWFRNTWSWTKNAVVPVIETAAATDDVAWQVAARHPQLGEYRLSGLQDARLLFTDNVTNTSRLWGESGPNYCKDAFHRYLIDGDPGAVRPDGFGTRFAAARRIVAAPGQSQQFDLRLRAADTPGGFDGMERMLARRRAENDVFYDELQPEAGAEDQRILRQVLAGTIWNKQFYHYNVDHWLRGDKVRPPAQRDSGRNNAWHHLRAHDVISMPDTWEYPWFAAWDLAYHCASMSLIDVDFSKQQVELLLGERYLHPTGQIPAYEWNFDDVNPPIHAAAALRAFENDRRQGHAPDYGFLRRVFHKLLLNYAWWLNRKDPDGQNLFDGGFLGLDNISVFDRSKTPLPPGYRFVQADATGWMAMYALNMTVIALELSVDEPDYEPMAVQCYEQFLKIAESIGGFDRASVSLWDETDGFYKDVIVAPDGTATRIDVFSWVGLIPLFACAVIGPGLLEAAPAFARLLRTHRAEGRHGHFRCQTPEEDASHESYLLALVDQRKLGQILSRVFDEAQFLSRYGIRSLSRLHAGGAAVGDLPGIGPVHIDYVPGEADSPMYGGNSNWRGPIWLPTNYSLVQALERYMLYLGQDFGLTTPAGEITLRDATDLIVKRVVDLYRRNEHGQIPALRPDSPFQSDPHWKDLCLFYEYFHAETGRGLGAAHQTGWTALLANLVMRGYPPR